MSARNTRQVTVGNDRATLDDDWTITVHQLVGDQWTRRAWFAFRTDFRMWCDATGRHPLQDAVTEVIEDQRANLTAQIAQHDATYQQGVAAHRGDQS